MGQTAPQSPSGVTGIDNGPGPWMKLLQGGLKGGLSGFSDMQNQNAMMRQGGGGETMNLPILIPMPQQPQVQLPGMDVSQNNQNIIRRAGGLPQGNNLNFYGGY